MENNFKINDACLQQLAEISNALLLVETKGDSTMVMFKIRVTLDAVLKQIQEDNQSGETRQEKSIIIDNTKKKEDK